MAIMTKERNIQVFSTTYDFLQSIKPEVVQLKKYFVGDKDYESL